MKKTQKARLLSSLRRACRSAFPYCKKHELYPHVMGLPPQVEGAAARCKKAGVPIEAIATVMSKAWQAA